MLVSLDVVSLFTRVPIREAMEGVRELFSPDISDLFQHVLTTTYFKWNNTIFEQKEGVAMGSPLSPVIANFYMERFEDVALSSAVMKPTCWLRYVDDTFVIWSHGKDELDRFLTHINSIHKNIQFTMETENNNKLPFLDVLVSRREDGTLGHCVYRKPTHTDRYLHKDSNHHPRQKRAVLKTLFVRANRICEPAAIKDELAHLTNVFQANGFSEHEIKRAFHIRRDTPAPRQEPTRSTAFLPYVEDVTDRIERLLRRHNVKTVFKPTHQVSDLLRSVKDARDPLSTAGVYKIPCSCGSAYIGTTKRSISTRIKEHQRNCRLGHTDKSAVAEHAFEERIHNINFNDTQVLSRTTHYYPRLNREAIEIFKHPFNFNRKEEGIKINRLWHPVLEKVTRGPSSPSEYITAYHQPITAQVDELTSATTSLNAVLEKVTRRPSASSPSEYSTACHQPIVEELTSATTSLNTRNSLETASVAVKVFPWKLRPRH